MIAAMLIAAQALAPAAAWSQTTRSTAPAAPAAPAKVEAAPVPARNPALDRRLALVVGNNTYKNAPLVNPINDARLVAKTLEGLGFEVMLRENLSLREFKAVMRQFATRLENEEGTGLLYYAGHGVQIEGRNFLLPIDVGTGDEYEVRDESVDLEDTLMSRLVRARKREKIIILDACRDNPFRSPVQKNRALLARGFAQMGSEKGSLIVYSTNPGNTAEDGTGKNSVFTELFAREIQKDGVEVGQALRAVTSAVVSTTKGRQTPWYNSSLLGEFYFKPVNARLEEEKRRKEVQQQVELALKTEREGQKKDEAGRIEAVVSARIAERERERVERERQYNAQIAEMKALLERRDKDLESARVQVASAARTRDEQIAALAAAEADRKRLERERDAAGPATAAQQARDTAADAARKQAETERLAKERREREATAATVSAERNKLLKLEAELRTADERAAREEAERQAKAAAEISRREAAAQAARDKAERDQRAQANAKASARDKVEREQRALADAQKKAAERDQLAQVEASRRAAVAAKREEAARIAKANAEKIQVLDEQAKQNAARERAAQELAQQKQQEGPATTGTGLEAQTRLAEQKVKRAKEEAERATREAESRVRLARIEEDVRRKATLEYEMLGRKATLPPALAALMTVEPQKAVIAGTNGDFLLRGVRLPADVKVTPAAPNVPAACAAFLGAWGGGRWNGERTAEIWVEAVDADCRGRAIYARGGNSLSGEAATHQRGEFRISGDTLTLELGAVRIELMRDGAAMSGRWLSGVNSATASFQRIPETPDRPVSLFANEAVDFGASPSRVISGNQVSERVMLPLPTTVPGVDTLTTLQLEAFLKTHPDAVLVDAVVASAHRTLPGAVWMPDLGVVTIGQLERSQIETAMRSATGGDPSRPVIVFERSSRYGWFGYHGVLRLLGMGYSNVYWYRGGLDAWHDAQFTLALAQAWSKSR